MVLLYVDFVSELKKIIKSLKYCLHHESTRQGHVLALSSSEEARRVRSVHVNININMHIYDSVVLFKFNVLKIYYCSQEFLFSLNSDHLNVKKIKLSGDLIIKRCTFDLFID